MSNLPLILISNDDGITSHGIRTLVELLSQIAEVVVVAPNKPQSGMGHAITIGEPLRLIPSDIFGNDIVAYECSGTPADCVKLGRHHVLKDRTPDLVVSGINHGSNASISVLYSGTVSAAMEAAIEQIPAIAFSIDDFDPLCDFSHAHSHILQIAESILKNGLKKGVALNVNFPKKNTEPLKGIRVCHQTHGRWKEEFDKRKDPYGRSYFWMAGHYENFEPQNQKSDIWALENNYVAIVPCQYDMTAYDVIEEISTFLS